MTKCSYILHCCQSILVWAVINGDLMGYRGRLTALTLTFSSSMIWAIYSQFMYGPYMEQKGRLIAVLLSLVLIVVSGRYVR
jgi:hypothetical protein